MKQNTLLENVKYILTHYVDTRNSDKLLMLYYWRNVDQVDERFDAISTTDFLYRATSPESITRARRKIQSKGELLPTDPKVIERRKLREMQMKVALMRGEVI